MNPTEKEVCNIAEGTTIKGSFKSSAHLRLEGKIIGNVKCGGRLVLSATASVEGDIECQNLLSEGKIKGNVVAAEMVQLLKTAELKGDVVCGRIQVEEGAALNGRCTMVAKEANKEAAKAK